MQHMSIKRVPGYELSIENEVSIAKNAAMGEMFNLAKDNMKPGDRLINFASGHPSTDVENL